MGETAERGTHALRTCTSLFTGPIKSKGNSGNQSNTATEMNLVPGKSTSNQQQEDGGPLGQSYDATFTSNGKSGITFYFIGCCHSPNLGDEETEDQVSREMRLIHQLQQGTIQFQYWLVPSNHFPSNA